MCDKFQKEFEGIWPRDFVNYFKERVLPKANRLGKWALGEVNIYDESFFNHAGEIYKGWYDVCVCVCIPPTGQVGAGGG